MRCHNSLRYSMTIFVIHDPFSSFLQWTGRTRILRRSRCTIVHGPAVPFLQRTSGTSITVKAPKCMMPHRLVIKLRVLGSLADGTVIIEIEPLDKKCCTCLVKLLLLNFAKTSGCGSRVVSTWQGCNPPRIM